MHSGVHLASIWTETLVGALEPKKVLASDRKHTQVTWAMGGSLAEVPYSTPMKFPSFASNARLSDEVIEATSTAAAVTAPVATTEGAAGGWWSVTAAATAALAASVAAAAATAAAWHAARAGGRRVAHGAGSSARNLAPACLLARLDRVHDCRLIGNGQGAQPFLPLGHLIDVARLAGCPS